MSLGLTKPGASAALKFHPKTGAPIEPLGVLPSGKVVWPVLGAASDDPDDPAYTGGGDDDEDEEDDEDEDEKPSKKKPVKKATKSKKDEDDDEDEDDEEEEDKPTRPERQAARYRTQLREEQKRNREMAARLQALEDKDKKPDEIVSRDLEEAKAKAEKLASRNRQQTLELAFFKANQVEWIDPADALKLVDLEDVDVDEDGTVDPVQLRKALRALAKAKPHLVKAAKSTESKDDDEEDTDDEPSSRRSAPAMNGGRKGKRATGPTRDQLAKKFPVLNRL